MAMDILEILHNMADHAETFHRFLGETNLSGELKERLIDHIILEEQENSVKLQEIHSAGPTAITQKMLDHSYFLQKMMRDPTMPHDLKQELLHHFMEEHAEWHRDLSGGLNFHEAGIEAAVMSAPRVGEHAEVTNSPEFYEATKALEHVVGTAHGGASGSGTDRQAGRDVAHGKRSHERTGSDQNERSHGGHGKSEQKSHTSETKSQESSGWTVGPMWNQGE